MADQTVRWLKANAGRFFYRRRVPERHQKTLGLKVWNRPCGKVSYQKAVSLVTTWGEQHDRLIQSLGDPSVSVPVRQATEARAMAPMVASIIAALRAGALPHRFDPLEAAKAGLTAAEQNTQFEVQDRLEVGLSTRGGSAGGSEGFQGVGCGR